LHAPPAGYDATWRGESLGDWVGRPESGAVLVVGGYPSGCLGVERTEAACKGKEPTMCHLPVILQQEVQK
jgi:hypothetical protein